MMTTKKIHDHRRDPPAKARQDLLNINWYTGH